MAFYPCGQQSMKMTKDIQEINKEIESLKSTNSILVGSGEGSIDKKIADKISEFTYLTKVEVTQEEINRMIADPSTAEFNKIYLVKVVDAAGIDKYLEYQRLGTDTISEVLCTGDTSTDLSEYVKKEEGKGLSSNDYTEDAVTKVAKVDGIENTVNELNSNLDTLEFGEVAGGKNLFKGDFIEKVLDTDINYTDIDLSKEQNPIKSIEGITFVVFGAYLKKGTYTFSYTNNAYFSLNRLAIAGTICFGVTKSIRKSYTWTQNVDGFTYFGIEGDDSETGVIDTPFSITPNIQIEKGTQATPYEPFIPSVKMLADEVNQQNESLGAYAITNDMLEMGHWWNGGNTSNEHIRVKKEYSLQSGFKGYVTNNTEKQLSIIKYNEDTFVGSVKEIEAGKTILVEVPSGSNYRMYEVETDFSKIASNIIVATNGLGKEVAELNNDLGSKVNFDRILGVNIPCEADQWTVLDNSLNWFQLNVIPILKTAYQASSGNQAGGLLRINANTGGIEFKADAYCDYVFVYLLKI